MNWVVLLGKWDQYLPYPLPPRPPFSSQWHQWNHVCVYFKGRLLRSNRLFSSRWGKEADCVPNFSTPTCIRDNVNTRTAHVSSPHQRLRLWGDTFLPLPGTMKWGWVFLGVFISLGTLSWGEKGLEIPEYDGKDRVHDLGAKNYKSIMKKYDVMVIYYHKNVDGNRSATKQLQIEELALEVGLLPNHMWVKSHGWKRGNVEKLAPVEDSRMHSHGFETSGLRRSRRRQKSRCESWEKETFPTTTTFIQEGILHFWSTSTFVSVTVVS